MELVCSGEVCSRADLRQGCRIALEQGRFAAGLVRRGEVCSSDAEQFCNGAGLRWGSLQQGSLQQGRFAAGMQGWFAVGLVCGGEVFSRAGLEQGCRAGLQRGGLQQECRAGLQQGD